MSAWTTSTILPAAFRNAGRRAGHLIQWCREVARGLGRPARGGCFGDPVSWDFDCAMQGREATDDHARSGMGLHGQAPAAREEQI